VPWIVYGGKYIVSWLQGLGFDVLDDIVDHRYDYLEENNTGLFGDKPVDFIQNGSNTVEAMKAMDFDQLQKRCCDAAAHNQQLLAKMQHNWPADFAAWWPTVVEKIK